MSEAHHTRGVGVRTPSAITLVAAGVVAVAIGVGAMAFAASDLPKGPVLAAIVGLVGGLAFFRLAAMRFDLFVLTLLAVRPLIDVFNLGGGNLLNPSVLIGLLFAVASCLWLAVRVWTGAWVAPSPLSVGLVVLLAAACVSCVVSVSPVTSIISTVKLSAAVLMFLVLEQALRSGYLTSARVMTAVAVSAALVVTIAFLQTVTGMGVLDPDIGAKRTFLPFVHPNVLAKYLVVVGLVGIAHLVLRRGAWRWRPHVLIGLAALGVALIGTFARVGWATLALGAVYLLAVRDRRAVPVALLLGCTVVALVPPVYDRVAELWSAEAPAPGVPSNSLVWRFQFWQHLIPLARLSPLNGRGYDTIQLIGGQDLLAHNVWVQSYVEMGIMGLAALIAAIVGVFVTLRRAVRGGTAAGPAELHAGIAVAAMLLIMLNTENLLAETTTLWYAAAAITCAYATPREVGPAVTPDAERTYPTHEGTS